MEHQPDKIGAITSVLLFLFSLTLKDMQIVVTVMAGIVAIISGAVSIYANIKNIKNKDKHG